MILNLMISMALSHSTQQSDRWPFGIESIGHKIAIPSTFNIERFGGMIFQLIFDHTHIKPIMFTDLCPVAKWFGIIFCSTYMLLLCWHRLKIQAPIQTFTRVLIWNFIWFVRYHCGNSRCYGNSSIWLYSTHVGLSSWHHIRIARFCFAYLKGEKNGFIYLKGWTWTNARVVFPNAMYDVCIVCIAYVENTRIHMVFFGWLKSTQSIRWNSIFGWRIHMEFHGHYFNSALSVLDWRSYSSMHIIRNINAILNIRIVMESNGIFRLFRSINFSYILVLHFIYEAEFIGLTFLF